MTDPIHHGLDRLRDACADASQDKRTAEAESALAEVIAAITGRPADELRRAERLVLESLHAMEVQAVIEAAFDVGLALDEMLGDGMTLPSLATQFQAKLTADHARVADEDHEPFRFVPDPTARFEPFGLTDVQRAYLLGRDPAYELGNVPADLYAELSTVDLDLDLFERAFLGMVARHDMLRAIILPNGHQRILENVPRYAIACEDVSGLAEPQRVRRLEAIREEMTTRTRAADRWPLFDCRATRLDNRHIRLHIAFDLLICDGPSFMRMLTELAERYSEPDKAWPELELSFRDYVLAADVDRGARYEQAREYWVGRLSDLSPAPALPYAKPFADIAVPRFHRRHHRLQADARQGLRERAGGRGLTVSMVLAAAYARVLGVWSAGQRFTLNVTVNSRAPVHPQIGQVIGDFTGLTLLEADTTAGRCFADLARDLQQQMSQDLDHREFTGIEVMREIARQHGPGTAVMPVIFTALIGNGLSDAFAPEWLTGMDYTLFRAPQLTLECVVYEYQGGLSVTWDSVDEVFAGGVLDAMFGAYCALVAELAAGDGAWDGTHRPLVPTAQLAVRERVNATAAPVPDALLHQLGEELAARSRAPAVIWPGGQLSYRGLDRLACQIGRWLRERGARPGQLIAIVMDKGWQQVAAATGVLYAGAAYLPIDAALPSERIRRLMNLGQVCLAVTSCATASRVDWPGHIQVLGADDPGWQAGADDTPLPPAAGPDDLAYVIFTSGSTGEPKGVMVSHRAAANTITSINRRFDADPADRVLGLSSLSFDLSVYDIFGTLAAAALVLPAPGTGRDPAHWARLVHTHRVSIWNTVPALMDMCATYCAASDPNALNALRLVMLSGDWIPLALPGRVRQLASHATVVSLGGATEAAIWSVCHPITTDPGPGWPSIPYGTPLANQALHILDRDLSPRPDWVPGEICITGTGLADGYWADPCTTSDRFPVRPGTAERLYRTGDVGRYRPDGTIEFLGRADRQIKLNGYRIEPGEIEHVLTTHPAITGAIVTTTSGTNSGTRLIAYATMREPRDGARRQAGLLTELRVHLASKLPDYMMPAEIVVLDEFPLTANGKVDIRKLRRLGTRRPAKPGDRTAPRTETERALTELWAETLGVVGIGIHENFFAVGGDSLTATRVVAGGRSKGLRVSVADLLANPTIAQLAAITQDSTGDSGEERVLEIRPAPEQRFEPFPLTDIQQAYLLGRQGIFDLGNVPASFYIEIAVQDGDLPLLTHAIRRLVARHDMLRAVILSGGRWQVLEEVPGYRVPVTDLRAYASERVEPELERIRDEMTGHIFNPATWPLFDIRLTHLDEHTSRLHMAVDLLIADGVTVGLLLGELTDRYNDPARSWPDLELSFRDYVVASAPGKRHERAREYWLTRVPDLPPAPVLPLAVSPSAVERPRFFRRMYRLDAPLWHALRERAGGRGLTVSMVLAAAYARVLGVWSAGQRFTLNVTVNSRAPVHPQIGQVIGDFTGLTLLEADTTAGRCFADLARDLQQQMSQDLDHREFTGIEVMREIARQHGPTRATMPVVFTSTLDADLNASLAGLGEYVTGVVHTPQVYLDNQAFELNGDLCLSWDSVDEVFAEGVLDASFGAYCALVAELAAGDGPWDGAQPPLTPNGKVDQSRPPEPVMATASPEAGEKPRNETEQLLLDVWRDLLGTDTIGVCEEFAALGGDSLLAMQVISKAAAAGLTIAPADFFVKPTIAGLAAAAQAALPEPEAAEDTTGDDNHREAPLLPRQVAFFKEHSRELEGHNYAMLFDVGEPLDRTGLRVALQAVLRHHEGLRISFRQFPSGWHAALSAAGGLETPLTWVGLTGTESADRDKIRETCAGLQESIRLDEPPLLRVAYFDPGPNEPGKLFMAGHWLIWDNYACRIFLEDLLSAHRQVTEDGETRLAPALPVSRWASHLLSLVEDPALDAERPYWQDLARRAVPEIPADHDDHGDGTVHRGTAESATVTLGPVSTAALRDTCSAGQVTMPSTLLAAIARALARRSGDYALRADVDGHGRRRGGAHPDTSRTIGRLSTRYPVHVRVKPGEPLLDTARGVTHDMDQVPAGGDNHDLLTYLAPTGRVDIPATGSRVLFNFLGRADALWRALPLRPSELLPVIKHGGSGDRYQLEFIAGIAGERLIVSCAYCTDCFAETTITALLHAVKRDLENARPGRTTSA